MPDVVANIHFPVAGLDLSGPYSEQKPAALPEGQDDDGAAYGRTCIVGKNVRTIEATTLRRRGGSRPGTVKYIPTPIVPGWIVQELASIVTSDPSAVG